MGTAMGALQKPESARKQEFGYVCRACSRCCQHKIIQVNPYEVARLARLKGMTTGEFRAAHTERGEGAILHRTEATDTCTFLSDKGCSVHSDRPLVCRLYPLGRRVAEGGMEEWLHATPHPQTAGEYTRKGTIADYITAQGALPFMRAADAYAQWVRDASAYLETAEDAAADDLVDMDAAITRHCKQKGVPEPSDIEQRRLLHMEILYRQLNQPGGRDEHGNTQE
jgi:Fe-S-cluster containining protein